MLAWVLTVALVVLGASAAVPQAPEPTPVPPEVIAKNLAENVLGEQTVKHVKVSNGGRLVDISWESATYKVSNSRETTRDFLKTEAELATGSIMGIMRPHTIRYVVLLGKKMLASGKRTRNDFSIIYAPDLGG